MKLSSIADAKEVFDLLRDDLSAVEREFAGRERGGKGDGADG